MKRSMESMYTKMRNFFLFILAITVLSGTASLAQAQPTLSVSPNLIGAGTVDPTITVTVETGDTFKAGADLGLSDFNFTGTVDTGLTPAGFQRLSDTMVRIFFSGTATVGDLSIQSINATVSEVASEIATVSVRTQVNPTVIDVFPVENAVSVPVNTVISATFDQDVSEVDLSGVTLTPATVNYNVALVGNAIVLSPNGLLLNDVRYTVTIPANAVENDTGFGNLAFTWSFNTGETPQIVSAVLNKDNEVIITFNVPTNRAGFSAGTVLNAEQVNSIFNFPRRLSRDNANHNGIWNSDGTVFTIQVTNTENREFRPDDTVSVRESAGLRNAAETSSASTSSKQAEGGWVDPPQIVSVRAETNNTFTIRFSEDTNRRTGQATTSGTTLSQGFIEELIDFHGRPLGNVFAGNWLDARTLQIVILDPAPATRTSNMLRPDDPITFRKSGRLRNSAQTTGTSLEVTETALVTGGWIDAPGINENQIVAAIDNTLTIQFNMPTNATPSLNVEFGKEVVDAILDFGDKRLGENYRGIWTDSSTLRITVIDTAGRNLIVGDVIRVRASANVRNQAGSSVSSAASRPMVGGWIAAPTMVSAIAASDDTLTITFNEATDQPFGPNLSRERINDLFVFERVVNDTGNRETRSLGDDYNGVWLSPTVLRITISDHRNRNFIPGQIIRLRGTEEGALRNEARTSVPSTSERIVVGTWGAPRMISARTSANGEEVVVTFSEEVAIVGNPSSAQLASLFTAQNVSFSQAIHNGNTIRLRVIGAVISPQIGNFTLTYTQNTANGWRINSAVSQIFVTSPSMVQVMNAVLPRLAVLLPGQSFVDGVGVSGTPNTLNAGIPFDVEVVLTNNAGTNRIVNDANNTISLSRRVGTGSAGSQFSFESKVLGAGMDSITITNVRSDVEQIGVQLVAVAGDAAGLSQHAEGISAPFDVRAPRLMIQLPGQNFVPGVGVTGPVPANITAGTPFGVTVTLVDVATQPIPNPIEPAAGAVLITLSKEAGDGALSGNLSAILPTGQSSVFIDGIFYSLDDNDVQIRATSSGPGVADGRIGFSDVFDVGAIRFAVQLPGQTFVDGTGITGIVSTSLTASVPFTVIATLVDGNMNAIPNTGGPITVSLDVSSASGTLTYQAAILTLNATQAVFTNVSHSMPEDNIFIIATGTGGEGIGFGKSGISSSFSVGSGRLLVQLPGQTFTPGVGISGEPAEQSSSVPFSVTVTLVDRVNQPLVNTATDVIALVTEVGTGALSAATRTLSATQAVFDNVSYNKSEVGVVIKAVGVSGEGLAAELESLSSPFTVTTGPMAKIMVTGPTNVMAEQVSEPITITAVDVNDEITTVSENTAFGLSSNSEGIVTFSPNAPVILAGQSSTNFTYTDSALGDKVITISGVGVSSVTFPITVMRTNEPEVTIVSTMVDHGMGFEPVVGMILEGALIRIVADAKGTVSGATPEIDVVAVMTSLLPEGVAASGFVALISEVVSPADAAQVRTVTATIEVTEGFTDSEFEGSLSVVVTATNADDRSASDSVALSFYKEDEPPVLEDSGVDEILIAQGFGGTTEVQTRNLDLSSNEPLIGILNTFRGKPAGFNANVGGGTDRSVYLSTGDVTGDGRVDVVISYGPKTSESTFPNLFYTRDGRTREVNGPPFNIFPHDNPDDFINSESGELRTAVGNFIGADKKQIAIAQGVNSNGIIRIVMHDPEAPNGWVVVGQFYGLEDLEGAIPAFSNNANGGVTLAAGDLTGNGLDELIVGQTNSETSTARFQVISFPADGSNGVIVDEDLTRIQFNALGQGIINIGNGGVNLAVGDMNGDGFPEVIATSMGNSRDHGDERDAAANNLVSIRKPIITNGVLSGFAQPAVGSLFNVMTPEQNPSGALSIAAGEFDGNLENGQELVVGTGALFDYNTETLEVTTTLPAPVNKFFVFKANYNEEGTVITSITNVVQLLAAEQAGVSTTGQSNLGRQAFIDYVDAEGNTVSMNPASGAVNVAAGNTFRTDEE